jgi:hypothetical protein
MRRHDTRHGGARIAREKSELSQPSTDPGAIA